MITYNIAILGATGMVGEALLNILHERNFPIKKVYALTSHRSEGTEVSFGRKQLITQDAATFDFSQADIAFFSAGSAASEQYVPIATAAGCIVIDNTAVYRQDPDIPLIIPEINPHRLPDYVHKKVIANPNCTTIQMLMALKPIYDSVGIQKIVVSTYQSVSGAGQEGAKELAEQTRSLLNGHGIEESSVFTKQIAFNVLPHIDMLEDNGYTREELKMIWEAHKILEDSTIQVCPTTVRVPVFFGHSASVYIETNQAITAFEAKALLAEVPGVSVVDDPDYPTAVTHASGQDDVFVGRIRSDLFSPYGLHLWVVGDNVRKGAALNSIQIAELLIKKL
jgi:aspartate-semialdehyde dehydrogenase